MAFHHDDFADVLSLQDEFASTAIYRDAEIDVLFDQEYSESLDVAGRNPVLYAMTSVVADATSGELVEVNGDQYRFKHPPEPDGQGLSRIELEKV